MAGKTCWPLLAVCLLLTSPPLADAECAWVLWQENQLSTVNDYRQWWDLHGAYATQEECVSVQKRIWQVNVNRAERSRPYGNIQKIEKVPHSYVSTSLKSGGYTSDRLMCLPDTIDPREKK
jgi:hypothetical protein